MAKINLEKISKEQLEQERNPNYKYFDTPELRYKDGRPMRKYNSPKLQAIEMENKQTAVEWLFQQLWDEPKDKFTWYALREKALQIEKQNKIDFLVWLKENHWHVYKDGTWFTSKDHAYIDGKPRNFYTEEQLIQKYNTEKDNNVAYKVQNDVK